MSELTNAQQDVLEKFREDVMSGRTLVLHAQSARGRYGYAPPIRHEDWGLCIERLGRMAKTSPRLAQVASAIMGKLNLYGTDGQIEAAVYDAAFHATNKPYVDYVGLAGPEPGRRSDRTHDWTLYDRVALGYWLEYATRPFQSGLHGVGWALAALAKEVRFREPVEMEPDWVKRKREDEARRERQSQEIRERLWGS